MSGTATARAHVSLHRPRTLVLLSRFRAFSRAEVAAAYARTSGRQLAARGVAALGGGPLPDSALAELDAAGRAQGRYSARLLRVLAYTDSVALVAVFLVLGYSVGFGTLRSLGWSDAVRFVALGGAIWVVAVLVLEGLETGIWLLLRRGACPIPELIAAVVASLEVLLERPDWPASIAVRRRIMRSLERAAGIVEDTLPRKLGARDPITDAWFRARARGMAAHLRWYKTWVLTPGPTTPDDLVRELRLALLQIVTRNWDALPVRDVTSAERRARGLSVAFRFAREAISALAPAALLWGLAWRGVEIPENALAYLWIAAVVWGIAKLLHHFDPGFKDTAAAFKSLKQALPSAKKEE